MKKKLVMVSALFASTMSLFATAGTASAATAFTISGTMVNGYFVVNSPWSQSVAVNAYIGRVRAANGVLGSTMICYENTSTGDVAIASPPQLGSGELTASVRIVGTAGADVMGGYVSAGRPGATDEADFCGAASGLFPGRKLVHARSGGKRVYFEARAGNDAILGRFDEVTADLGTGDDLAYVFADLFFYGNANDNSTNIDNVYSLNPDLDNDYFDAGNNARDCMTDYSGRVEQLRCGGSGAKVFMTTIPAGQTAVTNTQFKLCSNPHLNTSVEQCYDIIPSSR